MAETPQVEITISKDGTIKLVSEVLGRIKDLMDKVDDLSRKVAALESSQKLVGETAEDKKERNRIAGDWRSPI